jgi:hypothetical protein
MRGSATSAQVVGIYQTGEASFIVAVSNRVFLNSEHRTARGETVDHQLGAPGPTPATHRHDDDRRHLTSVPLPHPSDSGEISRIDRMVMKPQPEKTGLMVSEIDFGDGCSLGGWFCWFER